MHLPVHLPVPLVSIAAKITWTFLAPRILSLFVGSAANRRAANRLNSGDILEINKEQHWGALYRKSTWKALFSTIFIFALKPILSYSVNGRAVAQYQKMELLKLNGFLTMTSKNYGSTTDYKAYFGESEKCSTLLSTNKTRRIESWSGFWFEVKKQKVGKGVVELKPTGRYECKDISSIIVIYQGWDDDEIHKERQIRRNVLASSEFSKNVCSTADNGLCYVVRYTKARVIVEGSKVKIGYMINNYSGDLELWIYPIESDIMIRAFDSSDGYSEQGKWAKIRGDVDILDVVSSLSLLDIEEMTGNVHDDLRKAYLLGVSSRGKEGVIVTSTKEFPQYPGYEFGNITVGQITEGYISKKTILILFVCIGVLAVIRNIAVLFFIPLSPGSVNPEKLNIENSLYISSLAISKRNIEDGNNPMQYDRAVIVKRDNEISIQASKFSSDYSF